MAKRTGAFELTLSLTGRGNSRVSECFTRRCAPRYWTAGWVPAPGLPATRDLARQYQLSRGTIVNAFELLKSEGYLEGSVGSGTYVSKVLPDELFRVNSGRRSKAGGTAAAATSIVQLR